MELNPYAYVHNLDTRDVHIWAYFSRKSLEMHVIHLTGVLNKLFFFPVYKYMLIKFLFINQILDELIKIELILLVF